MMIDLFGRKVSILKANDPTLIGAKGTVMLESMKMLYLATPAGLRSFQKRGSVVKVEDTSEIVVCDSMLGRVEDRLNRRFKR
jgi:RNase P/RNase MRP subunit p29